MEILLFSAVAGICGTGVGGLITVLIGRRSPSMTCWLLAFASGIMISVVCFGLVPEALSLSNIYIALAGLVAGIVIIMLLNYIVDYITEKNEEKKKLRESGENPDAADLKPASFVKKKKLHETHEELYHEQAVLASADYKKIFRSGIIMLIAIGLHNIPEGMAIGAGGSHDAQLGILLSIIIAVHNIPEGMAIAAPLLSGGMKKWKIVLLSALSGAPTLLGGVIGYLLGNISDIAVAVSLSAAGGAMLYVVFGEIIPQSLVMTKSRLTTLISLFGIIIGLLVTRI